VLPTIRTISRITQDENTVFAETIFTRLVWSIISVLFTIILGFFGKLPLHLVLIFSINAVIEIGATALIRSFEGRQEMKTLTMYSLLERGIYCFFALSGLFIFRTITGLGCCILIADVFSLVLAYALFVRRFGGIFPTFSSFSLIKHSRIGFPFFVIAVASATYYKVDNLILAYVRSKSEVGLYNSAMRIIDAQIFIPLAIMVSIYPVLSQLFLRDRRQFSNLVMKSFVVFLLLGIIIAVFIFLLAPTIIRFLYSDEYLNAIPTLRILSPTIIFYCAYTQLSSVLIAMNKEVLFTYAMIAAMALNVLLNFLFIPSYGQFGVATIRVITEATLTLLLGIIVFVQMNNKFNHSITV
jgi:O-antigen/teichoic acid export membrane protein